MRILVTGGAGFIGSNFIRFQLRETDNIITNLDDLTYAGNLKNLSSVADNSNYSFVKGDINDKSLIEGIIKSGEISHIVNFAAESHVDRSIIDASPFIQTNINGTAVLLDLARQYGLRMLQVSTDEVYGSLGPTGRFTENTPLDPRSPYSASKAAADCLVQSYHHTYGLDTIITRCSNNYGPFQFPEKLIPLMVINSLNNKELPLYGDGMNIRDWIHVEDHCRGIYLALQNGLGGEIYNFGGESEKTNKEIVNLIINYLGKSSDLIRYVEDRLGHDKRYAIDNTKSARELGFEPRVAFEKGMKETIEWYLNNEEWWQDILSGEYMDYYTKNYDNR